MQQQLILNPSKTNWKILNRSSQDMRSYNFKNTAKKTTKEYLQTWLTDLSGNTWISLRLYRCVSYLTIIVQRYSILHKLKRKAFIMNNFLPKKKRLLQLAVAIAIKLFKKENLHMKQSKLLLSMNKLNNYVLWSKSRVIK